MNTLIAYEKNHEEAHLVCLSKTDPRLTLLQAFKANQFKVKEPNINNTSFRAKTKEAYLLPEEVFNHLGDALKKELTKEQEIVTKVLDRETADWEAAKMQDRLLHMNPEEAVTVTMEVNGKQVNAVDHIAPILDKRYTVESSDGYRPTSTFALKPL